MLVLKPNAVRALRLHHSRSTLQMCYRQEREATYPGYQAFEFLRYVVIHVRRVPSKCTCQPPLEFHELSFMFL